MTFSVLTDSTNEIIARSTIRSAAPSRVLPNKRLPSVPSAGEEEESTDLTDALTTVQSLNNTMSKGEAPIIDPDTLIGFSFFGELDGVQIKKTVQTYNKEENEFEITTPNGVTEIMSYQYIIMKSRMPKAKFGPLMR